MIVELISALAATMQAGGPPHPDLAVVHPRIPCWVGERSWTPPGEPQSGSSGFDTRRDAQPDRIEHNVDEFFDGGDLSQTYNFIDYHFDNDGNPLLARTYLDDDPTIVDIRFRDNAPDNAGEAMRVIRPEIICYLQKRFRAIDVLATSGYVRLWSLD